MIMAAKRHLNVRLVILGVLACVVSTPAAAYLGPGAGLSAIGSFLALLLAVVVAVFGFLWYPMKRIMKKRRQAAEGQGDGQENEGQ